MALGRQEERGLFKSVKMMRGLLWIIPKYLHLSRKSFTQRRNSSSKTDSVDCENKLSPSRGKTFFIHQYWDLHFPRVNLQF